MGGVIDQKIIGGYCIRLLFIAFFLLSLKGSKSTVWDTVDPETTDDSGKLAKSADFGSDELEHDHDHFSDDQLDAIPEDNNYDFEGNELGPESDQLMLQLIDCSSYIPFPEGDCEDETTFKECEKLKPPEVNGYEQCWDNYRGCCEPQFAHN